VLVAGAAGGPHIITAVLDILRSVIEFHEDVAAAVARPRLHMQWLPDTVYTEDGTFTPDVTDALKAMGYRIKPGAGSLANAVGIDANGLRTAAHDPRNATGLAVAE
jgi:gamma-glutamyltranspeptidase/glutathione hydrolase